MTTSELCASCHYPLLVEVASDSSDEEEEEEVDEGNKAVLATASAKGQATPQSVIDDLELSCGCHFHWECFLDSPTITQCPSCDRNISSLAPSGQQQVLVTVRNEGGVMENYDILPSATEEAYLRAYPEERRGHAFLEFVREGDMDAVACILKEDKHGATEDTVDEEDDLDVLRYCGTFEGISGSALHVAIRYQREEMAWFLLAMGSSLPWNEFPAGALEILNSFGLSQGDRRSTPDVRSVKDDEGRLPVDLAKQTGNVWVKWVESGKLNS